VDYGREVFLDCLLEVEPFDIKCRGHGKEKVLANGLVKPPGKLHKKRLDLKKRIEKIELGLDAMREALHKAGGGKWPSPTNLGA